MFIRRVQHRRRGRDTADTDRNDNMTRGRRSYVNVRLPVVETMLGPAIRRLPAVVEVAQVGFRDEEDDIEFVEAPQLRREQDLIHDYPQNVPEGFRLNDRGRARQAHHRDNAPAPAVPAVPFAAVYPYQPPYFHHTVFETSTFQPGMPFFPADHNNFFYARDDSDIPPGRRRIHGPVPPPPAGNDWGEHNHQDPHDRFPPPPPPNPRIQFQAQPPRHETTASTVRLISASIRNSTLALVGHDVNNDELWLLITDEHGYRVLDALNVYEAHGAGGRQRGWGRGVDVLFRTRDGVRLVVRVRGRGVRRGGGDGGRAEGQDPFVGVRVDEGLRVRYWVDVAWAMRGGVVG